MAKDVSRLLKWRTQSLSLVRLVLNNVTIAIKIRSPASAESDHFYCVARFPGASRQ